MRKCDFTKDAFEFLEDLQAKQFKQVALKTLNLLNDPTPADSSDLKGYEYRRVDSGEFRIVYRFDDTTVYVVLIGKRNDDEVYRRLGRKE